jgi:serine/threonine-protein kinase
VSQRGLEPDFVKVLDFGLVKNRHLDQADAKLTAANDVIGTPAYAAPEVITADHTVDGRADLYSLGCVAYFLLTGTHVFKADSAISMAIAHAVQTPEPPSQRLGRALPADLEDLVLACLAKTPEQRPQSAEELLDALRRIKLPDQEDQSDRESTSVRRGRAAVSSAFN